MSLTAPFSAVRQRSLEITQPLATEDFGVQPMADASPPKWHLAHTTWFFETFLLKPLLSGYRPFNDQFEYLFNSYYNGVGAQFPRTRRGTLSRPTVAEVMDYRAYVDAAMMTLLDKADDDIRQRTLLGINHEQQHQELMLTDLKYNFGHNPLFPAYREGSGGVVSGGTGELDYLEYDGGVFEIGTPAGEDFSFDNESPRHDVLLRPYALASRLVTNAEYLAFVNDGGYQASSLWLSDGWARIKGDTESKPLPLYWHERDGDYFEFTLGGLQPLAPDAPVCHVSGYEADAFARWSGARLPTEPEWEVAASAQAVAGNFYENRSLHPQPAAGAHQFFGDAWEWTSSGYGPYPGFAPLPGTLGEYNGKFMANQLVLRGGSCVTSQDHIRPGYRNFFYPPDQWQFTGIRLARDLT